MEQILEHLFHIKSMGKINIPSNHIAHYRLRKSYGNYTNPLSIIESLNICIKIKYLATINMQVKKELDLKIALLPLLTTYTIN